MERSRRNAVASAATSRAAPGGNVGPQTTRCRRPAGACLKDETGKLKVIASKATPSATQAHRGEIQSGERYIFRSGGRIRTAQNSAQPFNVLCLASSGESVGELWLGQGAII